MDSFDLADLIPESTVNSLQEVLQEFLFFLDSFFNSYSMCDNLILKTEDFVAYFLPHFEKGKKREWESYFKYYWPIRHGLQNYENQQNILLSILRDVVVRRREKSIDGFLDKTESKTTRRFVQTNVWNTPCVRDWTFRCKGSALDMSENQFDGVIRPLLLKKITHNAASILHKKSLCAPRFPGLLSKRQNAQTACRYDSMSFVYIYFILDLECKTV